MAFTLINPIAPGDGTKVDHYDVIYDNTVAIRDGELTLTGQAAGDIPFAISPTHLGRHPSLHWVDPVLTVPTLDATVTQEPAPVMGEIYADTTIRAWASFNVNEDGNAFVIRSSFNVKPIGAGSTDTRRLSAGLYEIHFVTPIGSALYAVLVGPHRTTDPRTTASVKSTRTSASLQVQLLLHGFVFDNPFDLAVIGV